ncbi:hypothetical protein D3C80_1461610 [compost metagenome]
MTHLMEIGNVGAGHVDTARPIELRIREIGGGNRCGDARLIVCPSVDRGIDKIPDRIPVTQPVLNGTRNAAGWVRLIHDIRRAA